MAKENTRRLSSIDGINLLFLAALFLILLVTLGKTPYGTILLLIYPGLFLFILYAAGIRRRWRKDGMRRLAMGIYPILFLFGAFETFFMLLPYFNEAFYDGGMAWADHAVFGVHPTVWMEQWASPPLTDFMYLLYLFYFPMPLIPLLWLYRKRRFADLERSMFIYLAVYYSAYLVYFFVPVEGPRFYLEKLQQVPLDGIVFAAPIRGLIDVLEPNKSDCFPSLHAAITLVTLLAAFRIHRKMFYFLLPLCAGILLSLVYCRYHYVVDVVAGLAWAFTGWMVGGVIQDKVKVFFAPHFGNSSK